MGEIAKPAFNEPCNGCGLCCATELCDVAEYFFEGAPAPCPALEWEDGRSWCGLVRHPSRHLAMHFNADRVITPLILKMIPIGQGCGMPDERKERSTVSVLEMTSISQATDAESIVVEIVNQLASGRTVAIPSRDAFEFMRRVESLGISRCVIRMTFDGGRCLMAMEGLCWESQT